MNICTLLTNVGQGLAAMVGANHGTLRAQTGESSSNNTEDIHDESQPAAVPSGTASTGGDTARPSQCFPSEDVAVFECQASKCQQISQTRATMRAPPYVAHFYHKEPGSWVSEQCHGGGGQ